MTFPKRHKSDSAWMGHLSDSSQPNQSGASSHNNTNKNKIVPHPSPHIHTRMVNFNIFQKSKTKRKRKREITFVEVQRYFDLSIKDASQELGISLTQLKRVCRQLDIPKWPHRKVRICHKIYITYKYINLYVI